MMKYPGNQITLIQYIFIITGTQVGIGILTLPRLVAEGAGTDGWISILLGWLLAVTASLVIIQVMRKNPTDTLFTILRKYFGRWLGGAVSLAWILYAAFAVLTVIYSFINIINTWLLPETRSYIIMFFFAYPIYLVAAHGIRVVGRYSEFIFFFTFWMPVLLSIPVREGKFVYLLPLLKEGIQPVLMTAKSTILSFLGFELAMIWYPFLRNKKAAAKGIIIANTISLVVFLHVTLVCFVYFSPDEITNYIWPTLNIVKPIQIPFLERFEIMFLSFYLFVISTTVIPYLFTSVYGTSLVFGLKGHQNPLRIFLVVLIILTYFLSVEYKQVEALSQWWGNIGFVYAYIFPVLLLIYSFIFSRLKGRKKL
ncbi:MAG: endospore germination permease [Desulfotomaculum sp.]|nr:endospore germination permease [Desulfotomaculum sp.]